MGERRETRLAELFRLRSMLSFEPGTEVHAGFPDPHEISSST